MSSSSGAGVRGTPIFNLNDDALILVIEAVAVLRQHLKSDKDFQESGLSGEVPPDPLLSFSMTNKHIRALAEPIVFRSSFLRMEFNHCSKNGIRKIKVGNRMVLAVQWPAAVVHARRMTIKMPAQYRGHSARTGFAFPLADWEKSMPKLLPVSLQRLLEVPRVLRRLHFELPAHIIDHMAATAMFRPATPLPQVTNLVVCEYGAFIISLCRNTTALGIVSNARNIAHIPPLRGFALNNILAAAAATLSRLTALSISAAWTDAAVGAVHARLPRLSELRLMHPVTMPWPEVTGMQIHASRFSSLRAIGMNRIQGVVERLSDGGLVWDYRQACAKGLDNDLDNSVRACEEMASGLLYCEHPALERVEISNSWGKDGGLFVYAYIRDEDSDAESPVGVVERLRADESAAYWQW